MWHTAKFSFLQPPSPWIFQEHHPNGQERHPPGKPSLQGEGDRKDGMPLLVPHSRCHTTDSGWPFCESMLLSKCGFRLGVKVIFFDDWGHEKATTLHTHSHTYSHTHSLTHTLTYTHTCTHTHTHAHTHTHTHTHSHTHSLSVSLSHTHTPL